MAFRSVIGDLKRATWRITKWQEVAFDAKWKYKMRKMGFEKCDQISIDFIQFV